MFGYDSYQTPTVSMATITVTVKIKNKDRQENPLWVIFRHQKTEVAISTGEQISPADLKKGKVTGPKSIPLNQRISQISADLHTAFDVVSKRGEAITNTAVRLEYERIGADRETEEKRLKFFQNEADYQGQSSIYAARTSLTRLEQEIQERREAILLHQQRLAELEGTIPSAESLKEQLFVTYVQRYCAEKKNSHVTSTQSTYRAIISLVNEFNPRLRIMDINRVLMYELEDFMIKKPIANTTVENYTSKIKGICNYYAVDLNLSPSYKQYRFDLPTHENDIIYLTPAQMIDFWYHDKKAIVHESQPNRVNPKKSYQRVRDMFMFMCATSLRYVDLFDKDFRECLRIETDGEGNNTESIVLYPQKTRKKQIKVSIPLTAITKCILERNNYTFKQMKDSAFRDLLREYCSDIPSFQKVINNYTFNGQTKKAVVNTNGDKVIFWQAIGAHTGRRTWINFAFQSGWTVPEIIGVTGHLNINTLMVYASRTKVIKTGKKPIDLFNALL